MACLHADEVSLRADVVKMRGIGFHLHADETQTREDRIQTRGDDVEICEGVNGIRKTEIEYGPIEFLPALTIAG